jgi:hypothetical protein
MTGDIFSLNRSKTEFGILITPECDIKKVVKESRQNFSILKFNKKDFDNYVTKSLKNNTETQVLKTSQRKDMEGWFNQPNEKLFFLPSFPFNMITNDYPALIDFSNSILHIPYSKIISKKRICKLNPPFIQQLRQKYLSYIGRVGVPAVPEALRKLNVKHF